MALNFQTLKTRALTALIFVIVMLGGLLWNYWSFLALFTLIHFGCWFEYLKLVEKIYSTQIDIVIKWLFAICGLALMAVVGIQSISFDVGIKIGEYNISFKLLFWILLLICLAAFLFQNKKIPTNAKWMSFSGLAYISLAWGFMLNLRMKGITIWCGNGGGVTGTINTSSDHFIFLSVILPITIISSIWINDTMAYLVGSLIGKTPFSKISPKKTLEGTIGGIILCVVTISLVAYFSKVLPVQHAAAIAAICGIFGTAGDLLESKIKRMADVKDSGSFMPGHGGFLDRFDSLLLATPFVWIYVHFFM